MTTDITELAQSHELLIANGQQTADLLRNLADNEIDSDYFAVVSECESYGKETDAELSITEFALRAAGYVDALVEALEKSESRLHEVAVACATAEQALEKAQRANAAQDDHINQQQDRIEWLEKGNQYAGKRIAELESRTVKLPKTSCIGWVKEAIQEHDRKWIQALTAAGIKVEAE